MANKRWYSVETRGFNRIVVRRYYAESVQEAIKKAEKDCGIKITVWTPEGNDRILEAMRRI